MELSKLKHLFSLVIIILTLPHASSLDTIFSFNEPIAQFTQDNFTSTVIGSDVAWIIDFYASWCGHCQRFAPVWVSLARSIQRWQRAVRIGAVSCSDPRNTALCRYYNIWGYPTVKFFPSDAASSDKGYEYNGRKSMEHLRDGIIDYLDATTTRNSGLPLKPVSSIAEAKALRHRNTNHLFLVVTASEPTSKRLAKGAILDLSLRFPEIVVAWSHRDLLNYYSNLYQVPSVFRVTDEQGMTRIQGKGEFVSLITQTAQRSDSITTSSTTLSSSTTSYIPTTTQVYIPSDGLHSQDLDSSIYYSLFIEVASQGRIGRSALRALKRYVYMLAKYHSGSSYVVKFLRRVHNWLSGVHAPLSGNDWKSNITRLQKRNAFVPQGIEWTGCRGSLPRYRGYPCSLWMTFHSLTVNAYLSDDRRRRYNPQTVLIAIREYVRHFMGCRNCANHFTSGMAAHIERNVRRAVDGVLYLWQIHNSVNNRLHDDTTEDPNNRKIQFPATSVCSECRRYGSGRFNPNVTWNDVKVLAYLLDFYRAENIIRDSLPATFQRGNGISSVKHAPASISRPKTCVHNSTDWSTCSETCGTGVSSRVSNQNTDCKSKLEFRLCQLRPCNVKNASGGILDGKCNKKKASTYRSLRKKRLTYKNCRSVNKYIWRYCGHCSNKCCHPVREETISVTMECKYSQQWYKTNVSVMKITSCKCEDKC